MARLFLSTSLGVALAFSAASGAFAATSATGLVNTLSGQPGVTTQLLQAVNNVQLHCETPGATASSAGQGSCRLDLQTLLNSIPPGLSPTLVNEINELVSTLSASLPPEGQTGAITPDAGVGPSVSENPGGGSSSVVDDRSASLGAP
ncbi:hypothetical protein [Pleomorphomonas koreensis]|uniref:hypothetical protein n=1 Tax=Pleomorphomonas koreensis TaxID=257440 RepID=UPI00047AF576|nr:hypothetical protein [Pleomorphomonas koreensis]